MIKRLIGILVVLLPSGVFAQLFPLSDQYQLNPLLINPAFSGCHDAASISAQYRNQWVGFQDAPKRLTVSAHSPISFDRMGLGLIINRNTIGIYRKTDFMGNYAYRHELHNGKLALGLGAGFTLYHIRWDELNAVDGDDVLLPTGQESAFLPDFSIGVYYYTRKYFVGISIPGFLSHVNNENSGKYEVKNDFSAYNYYFSGGYEIDITSTMNMLPSLLVKVDPDQATQVDINLQIGLKEKIWLGMGYRASQMIIGTLQCQVNDQLSIAYSYDFNFGNMGNYQKGSHEVLLGYVFSYKRLVPSPRQF